MALASAQAATLDPPQADLSTRRESLELLWKDDFSGNWLERWPLKWSMDVEARRGFFEYDGETWIRVHMPADTPRHGYGFATSHSPRDNAYLQFRIRFDEDFDWVKGGKLPGLYGGNGNTGESKPNGTDGWSVRFMWRADGMGSAYVYHPDQDRRWGDHFRLDNFWFQVGIVHTIGLAITMNTPGQNDGIIRAWLDDVLVVEKTDIRLRDIDDLQIDGIRFSAFFGGSDPDWAPTKNETIEFGDFRLYGASAPDLP